jgi:hypothetical protein
MKNNTPNPFDGTWTYRSLKNDPKLGTDFDALEFGRANLEIVTTPDGQLTGRIYDTGWELKLYGGVQYGNPATLWFRGSGKVSGAEWIYDYLCYLTPWIPEGVKQIPALTGSVTRAIPHPDGNGGISPAGVVCSFYAVKQPAKAKK